MGQFGRCLSGRDRGRLCVQISGMPFYLSTKGNRDTDIMEEIVNVLILKVLRVLKGNFELFFRTTL